MSDLSENLKRICHPPKLEKALHKLRNFDSNSIGRWKKDKDSVNYVNWLLNNSEINKDIVFFMKKYGYDLS